VGPGEDVGGRRPVAHSGRYLVGPPEVLGQAVIGIVAEQNLGDFAQTCGGPDVVVMDNQFDLGSAPHEVFEAGDHLGLGSGVELGSQVVS
jgi:hypothetical protein